MFLCLCVECDLGGHENFIFLKCDINDNLILMGLLKVLAVTFRKPSCPGSVTRVCVYVCQQGALCSGDGCCEWDEAVL